MTLSREHFAAAIDIKRMHIKVDIEPELQQSIYPLASIDVWNLFALFFHSPHTVQLGQCYIMDTKSIRGIHRVRRVPFLLLLLLFLKVLREHTVYFIIT